MQLYTLPSIEYLRLRFHLKALHDCDLPAWKGSLLRGAFGHALRRTACTMNPGQLCENCMLRSHCCSYTRIFETFITEQPPPFLKGLDTSPYSLSLSYQYKKLKSNTAFFLQILHANFTSFYITYNKAMQNKTRQGG